MIKRRNLIHLGLLLVFCTSLFFGAKVFLNEEDSVFGFSVSQILPSDMSPLTGTYSVRIEEGREKTSSRYVMLDISHEGNATKMAIANEPTFAYSSIEEIKDSAAWDLCAFRNGVKSPVACEEGIYTVYLKFYTASGVFGEALSDTIEFTTAIPEKKYKLVPEAHFMDLNFDDKIDKSEWGFWQQNVGKTGENTADFNRDKVVDLKDLIMLMKYWKTK